MKKGLIIFKIINMVLVIGFILSAYASTGNDIGIYDLSVPEDQLVTLEIAGGLKVVEFNGITVSWAENGSIPGEERLPSKSWEAQQKGSKYKTTIRIPAGEHFLRANLFLWEYNKHPGGHWLNISGERAGYIWADGLEISYDFLPGHTYFLRPVLNIRSFGRDREVVDYIGQYLGGIQSIQLRIDENGVPIAEGPEVTR